MAKTKMVPAIPIPNRIRMDWTVSFGTIIQIVVVCITLMNYGGKIVYQLNKMDARVDIMWRHFLIDNIGKFSLEEQMQMGNIK